MSANMREAYAGTGRASLEWNPDAERSIDRVAAAGKANALGVNLWKAKNGLESVAFLRAVDQLSVVYSERYRREDADLVGKLCFQAISEWVAQFCTTCAGTREVMHGELKTICTACAGSGVRRYTDEQRARMMMVSFDKMRRMGGRFRWLHDYISREDWMANDVMARNLERE